MCSHIGVLDNYIENSGDHQESINNIKISLDEKNLLIDCVG
jgi:hypothetical protein